MKVPWVNDLLGYIGIESKRKYRLNSSLRAVSSRHYDIARVLLGWGSK